MYRANDLQHMVKSMRTESRPYTDIDAHPSLCLTELASLLDRETVTWMMAFQQMTHLPLPLFEVIASAAIKFNE